jgi:hypothetical protein
MYVHFTVRPLFDPRPSVFGAVYYEGPSEPSLGIFSNCWTLQQFASFVFLSITTPTDIQTNFKRPAGRLLTNAPICELFILFHQYVYQLERIPRVFLASLTKRQ